MDTGGNNGNEGSCAIECVEILDLDTLTSLTTTLDPKYLETPSTAGPIALVEVEVEALTDSITSRFKPVSDPDYTTPKIKSTGFLDQPVRRRLIFSPPSSENVDANEQVVPTTSEEPLPKEPDLDNTKGIDKPDDDDGTHYESITSVVAEANNQVDGYTTTEPVTQDEQPCLQENLNPAGSLELVKAGEEGRKPLNESNRRVAQLVIWTKPGSSAGKLKSTTLTDKKVAPPPVPVENPPKPAEPDFKKADEELFIVQYPVRSLTETTKNKTKGPKRRRGAISPAANSHYPKRKSGHKQKRSAASSGHGTSSGRAYRAYLHTCLEKQREQLRTSSVDEVGKIVMKENGDTNLLWLLDFKVEKLFQPEQGVALPGEIVPPVPITTTAPSSTCAPPAACTSELSSEAPPPPPPPPSEEREAVVLSQITHNNTLVEENKEEAIPSTSSVPSSVTYLPPLVTSPPPPAAPQQGDPFQVENNCTASSVGDTSSSSLFGICIESESGGESTLFELPDRFTVTTDSANEFDLLIQNVVHEEMVDDIGEDELMKYERYRKRMRLSEGSTSRASIEDGIHIMDEAGKPRCTYTELIEKALTETGGLTVSEIYNWISERYPFFKPDDDRWKNSVRHNLSINPYFKKGDKARSGAGHLWTISEESKGLRPSMVSWDERRKSPSDPCDIIMPIESETDRAVANILGRYASECRASQQASTTTEKENGRKEGEASREIRPASSSSPKLSGIVRQQETSSTTPAAPQLQQQAEVNSGATCDPVSMPETATFNLNELNSGQFTVDLSGITIPEGGSLNLEDLASNGRLIYIQTDPDANKENDSSQALILNEYMLSELTGLTGGSTSAQDDDRFASVFTDPSLSFDLGFGKVDPVPCTSFNNDVSQMNSSTITTSTSTFTSGTCQEGLGAPGCSQMLHSTDHSIEFNPHQDLISLDQVIPMSTYESAVSTGSNEGSGLTDNLTSISAAALYESKELGISYMYQTEPGNHDLL